MTKQVIRGPSERLKVRSGISEQRLKVFALIIMGDNAGHRPWRQTSADHQQEDGLPLEGQHVGESKEPLAPPIHR